MPIPMPHDDEEQSKFMNRCMGDSVMMKEFPENKQRVAVCMSQYRKKGKKKKETKNDKKENE